MNNATHAPGEHYFAELPAQNLPEIVAKSSESSVSSPKGRAEGNRAFVAANV